MTHPITFNFGFARVLREPSTEFMENHMLSNDTTPHSNSFPERPGSQAATVTGPQPEEPSAFNVASGTLEQRIQAARDYLDRPQLWMQLSRTPDPRIWAKNIRAVKRATITNLIRYFGLTPPIAHELMWEYPSPDPEVIDQCWMDRLEARFGENTFVTEPEFAALARQAMDETPSLGLPGHEGETHQADLRLMREILRLVDSSHSSSDVTLAEIRAVFADIFGRSSSDTLEAELLTLVQQAIEQGRTSMVIQPDAEDGQIRVRGISATAILAAKDLWEYMPYGLSRWRMKQSHQKRED